MFQEDEVHLWSVDVEGVPEFGHDAAQLAVLSPVERERMERFRFPIDQQMYGVSHVLVRKVLSRYVNMPPESLRFSRGPHGKPALIRLPGSASVEFNLTHTRGLAALAVTTKSAVGIDAERGDRSIGHELAERIFSDQERRDLTQLPDGARATAMLRLWTLKEAYVKALGVGLRLSVADLSFSLSENEPPRFEADPFLEKEPERWRFLEVKSRNPYVLSLAVENPGGADLSLRLFDGATLLREEH